MHNRAKRREDNRVFKAVRCTQETDQSAGARFVEEKELRKKVEELEDEV